MPSLTKTMLLFGNQGAGGPAPFSDDFNRADGALGNDWTGANWSISGMKAICTPVLGDEMLANPGFDSDLSGWTDVSTGTGAVAWENAGSPPGRAAYTGSGAGLRQVLTSVAGTFYRVNMAVGLQYIAVGSTVGGENIISAAGPVSANPTGRAINTTLSVGFFRINAAAVDTATCKAVSGVAAVRTCAAGDGYAETPITYTDATTNSQAGILHYVDDDNFVVGYHESRANRLRLAKKVAGTWTELANVAATYSAGAKVRLTRSGTNYSVDYGGSELISATAVADAVFVTADKWGLFATHENAGFDSFDWAAA